MNKRKVEVLSYDSAWPSIFEAEKSILSSLLGNIAISIEHIGSTCVVGLAAKPVIDILVEVSDLSQLDDKSNEFISIGYEVKGENGIPGRRYYQKGGNERSHHIHAFLSGSEGVFRHRAFKEYLIAHPNIAQSYAEIKKQAAIECEHDNELYISLKNSFILEHEKKSVQWFGN